MIFQLFVLFVIKN